MSDEPKKDRKKNGLEGERYDIESELREQQMENIENESC